MSSFFRSLRIRLVALAVGISLLGCLFSCSEKPSPTELLSRFCDEYGLSADILSPSFREGERGHVSDDFFEKVFLESPDSVSDYAIIFLSSLNSIGECSVFLCYSEYDALLVAEALWRRVDFLKASATGMDTSCLADAVIFKSGRYAVMCALSDNARAERIWRKIL